MATEQFSSVHIDHMHNEESFQFYTEFRSQIREVGAETLGVEEPFGAFSAAWSDLDKALEIIRKSKLTKELTALDKKRDNLFKDFCTNVKSFLRHFEAAKVEAAEDLMLVVEKFYDAPRKNYNEETATVYNFIHELQPKYTAQLTLLALSSWVTELDKANKEFDNLYNERVNEDTDKSLPFNVKEIRKVIVVAYEEVCDYIYSGALLNKKQECIDFIKRWNIMIKKYEDALAIREGKRAASDNSVKN